LADKLADTSADTDYRPIIGAPLLVTIVLVNAQLQGTGNESTT